MVAVVAAHCNAVAAESDSETSKASPVAPRRLAAALETAATAGTGSDTAGEDSESSSMTPLVTPPTVCSPIPCVGLVQLSKTKQKLAWALKPLCLGNAFTMSKSDSSVPLFVANGGKSYKSHAMEMLCDTMECVGTDERQAACIVAFCTKVMPQIGLTLGLVENPNRRWMVADNILLKDHKSTFEATERWVHNQSKELLQHHLECCLPNCIGS
jgi:hypothetical protein